MFRFSKCQWGPEMCPAGIFREKASCPAKASKTTSERLGEVLVHGQQADTRPALPGDERRAFGNQCLGRLGITCEEGSSVKSRGSAPTQTVDVHRQGASCRISRRGRRLYFWNSQEKKGREESLSSPLFTKLPGPRPHAHSSPRCPWRGGWCRV